MLPVYPSPPTVCRRRLALARLRGFRHSSGRRRRLRQFTLRHYFVAGKRNTIIKGKNVRASYDETTKKFISQNVYVQLQPDTGITKIIRYLNNTIYIYVSNRTYLYLYIHVYMYKC